MKNDVKITIGFALALLVTFAIVGVTTFFGCEDSRAEKESHFLWICDECDSRFSNIRHRNDHKCYAEERLTEEQWELKQLTENISEFVAKEPNNVWGQGDPDPSYIENFGNGNLARLCFVQTQTINNQGQRIAELALRISQLEDPNGPEENKTPDKPR